MVALKTAPTKKPQPGEIMADDHGAPMDYKQANQTYEGFLALLKWGALVTALTGLLVIFLIAPKG